MQTYRSTNVALVGFVAVLPPQQGLRTRPGQREVASITRGIITGWPIGIHAANGRNLNQLHRRQAASQGRALNGHPVQKLLSLREMRVIHG